MIKRTTARAALVTGGSQRIGRDIVEALAGAGYAVAIHCNRSRAGAEALAASIVGKGGIAAVVGADLSEPADVAALLPAASDAIGPLSMLVNSAAEFELDAIGSLDAALWNHQFAINLRAPVFLAEAFATQLADGCDDASIVNIIDQRVLAPRPDHVSYYLSKAALHVATRTLAQALAPRIRVNAIGPGPTFANTRQTMAEFEAESAGTLLGHGNSGQDIAKAVLYLAGARSVTGQMIAVDAGQHLVWRE